LSLPRVSSISAVNTEPTYLMGRSDQSDAHGPFGETLRSTGLMASKCNCRFSMKYTDQESGWSYYGHRYYSPALGRWTSCDPLRERLTGRADIVFVLNSPLIATDYLGLLTMNGGCCCPSDIYLLNWEKDLDPVMGHSFSIAIRVEARRSGRCEPCSLKWEEFTDVPYRPGMPANAWVDWHRSEPLNPLFTPWERRTVDAPYFETIELNDNPHIGAPSLVSPALRDGRYVRNLKIRVTVTAGEGCLCAGARSVERSISQRLVAMRPIREDRMPMVPIWEESYLK
jgi:RHS repeat-associated protein